MPGSACDRRGGIACPQVAVDSFATDAELGGQHGLTLSGSGAFTQLVSLLGGEGGFAAGVDATLFGRGDAAKRALPMSPEDLLEAAVLVYLRGLGLTVPTTG